MVLGEVITESEDDMLFWGREKPNARAPQHRQTKALWELYWASNLIGSSKTCDSLSSAQEKTGKYGEIRKQCERPETQEKKLNLII